MKEIKNEGSQINAAEKSEISFRKAWNLIKKAENQLGFILVDRHRGGARGGCSNLIEEGSKLLEVYQKFVVEFDQSIYNVTKKFFKTINS